MNSRTLVWEPNGEHIANGRTSSDGVYTLYRLEGYVLDRRNTAEYCR
jgi:hypothetical protein